MIAFAAAPGAEADDGDGDHSPFAAALLEHVETRGIELQQMLTRVTASVQRATQGRQTPEVTARGFGREYFLAGQQIAAAAPPAPASAPAAPPVPAIDAIELRFWESAERGNTRGDYQAYLRRYPDGGFAELARSRVATLEEARTAAARPAPPPTPPPSPAPAPPPSASSTPAPPPASNAAQPAPAPSAITAPVVAPSSVPQSSAALC